MDIEAKVKEINEQNARLITEMQAENERRLKGYTTEAVFNDLKATWEKRFDAQEKELARIKTPTLRAPEGSDAESVKQFHEWFEKSRKIGLAALNSPEQKVLTIADTTHAGVLAPYEYVNEIIKGITLYSPMRQVARVRRTDKYAAEFPTETAIGAATWVAESSEKTETTGLLYALNEIPTFEMKILYKATQKMLEDSQFNLEQEIMDAAARAFGTLEGTSFYSGNGTTAPEGIITNSTVLADARSVVTDNVLAMDDLIGTFYQLANPYAKNASWMINRTTFGVVVMMKSATTNTYLLQPSLQAGQPMNLLGAPVLEWSDFPAITSTTLSDGQIVAAFGDFGRGYVVLDRVDITVQRLVEKYAEFGMIGFLVRKRVGGKVVLAEAIQLLKNITS